jgi:hypothetical protein
MVSQEIVRGAWQAGQCPGNPTLDLEKGRQILLDLGHEQLLAADFRPVEPWFSGSASLGGASMAESSADHGFKRVTVALRTCGGSTKTGRHLAGDCGIRGGGFAGDSKAGESSRPETDEMRLTHALFGRHITTMSALMYAASDTLLSRNGTRPLWPCRRCVTVIRASLPYSL